MHRVFGEVFGKVRYHIDRVLPHAKPLPHAGEAGAKWLNFEVLANDVQCLRPVFQHVGGSQRNHVSGTGKIETGRIRSAAHADSGLHPYEPGTR